MLTNYARRFLVLCVLVGLLTAVLVMVTAVTAQPPNLPDSPDERNLLPHWPQAEESGNSDNSILSPDVPSWSKGVFQSYRDGNWEIYSSAAPGRLTFDGSSDMHPRYNRGATRIVFSSNRDGDYEVYAMNADGSGLQMLTSNTAIDVNPIWSPDGTRIAFQSYRDGQSEIYVMNADGSGETRLTVNGSYDGDPSWSPDGSKIAFRSARTGTPFIYVMNNNGTGVVQLSTQPSYYVAWSPDGSQIAYTADLDGDNFFEMWLMNADGSNQRMIFDPNDQQADAWVRGWSPDGRSITFTNIRFIQYQGNWYWEWAYIAEYDLSNSSHYSLASGNVEWHPDWQTTDITPPHTQIERMPTFSQIPGFQVRWSGNDQGSGSTSYDVQYQVGVSGPWVDWHMGVTETSAAYTAVPGTTVSFRARARDNAFNVEEWSTANNPTTTFYTWSLWGELTDNRGIPITQAPLSIAPTPINDARTDDAGSFFSRLKTEGSHTLDVIRSGYGNLAQTTLNMENLAHIYLPPGNDVLQNGGFEAVQPLADWTTTGTVTAVTTPRYTGTKSALLGNTNCSYPCLSSGESLDDYYDYSDMVVDSQGVVHVVGAIDDGRAAYISRTAAGWGNGQQLSTGYGFTPRIAMDENDGLHVFWTSDTQVYYCYKPANGSWSAPVVVGTLPDTPNPNSYRLSQAITDNQGNPHVLIGGWSSYYLSRQSDGDWSVPTPLVGHPLVYVRGVMTLGPDDVLHHFWTESSDVVYPSVYRIVHQSQSPNGSWGAKEVLPFTGGIIEGAAFAQDGTLHLVWQEFGTYDSFEIYHAVRATNGDWSDPIAFQSGNDYYDGLKSHLSVDSVGRVHAISYNSGTVSYHVWLPGSGWQGEVSLAAEVMAEFPRTAVDQYDIVHLLVPGIPGSPTFNTYFRSLPATTNSTAVLSQQVTIPADMPAPTLAFMAQRPGDLPGDGSGLELLVSDGVTTTAVPLANGGAAWSQYWADMSPWAGQTVTVNFQLTQVSGDPRVRAAIDDVTLGSAYPDIWVRGSSPGSALPGDTVVYRIEYGNRGRVAATNGELTATWPDSLTFVSANITPTWNADTLTWSLGELAAESTAVTILVTATVDASIPYWESINLPVTISSTTSEVEQLNNQVVIPLVIAHRLFMPVLFKP